MSSPSIQRITTLSQQISENSKLLTDYLTSKGLDAASFDVNGLEDFPISPNDAEAFKARFELVALTKELHDISVGPKEHLRYLAWDSVNSLSLQATWEFKVHEAVPLEGVISYEDLAAKVVALNNGLDVGVMNLRRLVRHAMTNRLFAEPQRGYVAHTRSSRILVEDEQMNSWVGFMCRDLWLPVASVVDAMKKWPASEESNQTGVNLAYGQSLPWFDFIQRDEVLSRRYNLAMQAHGGGEGYALEFVVDGYPWGDLPDGGTVVDMGGNQGYVSFAIANAFPNLNFIVQDTAGMRTPGTIGAVPETLRSRVQLTTHDFFTPQVVVGADVYLLRMILHGFSDKYCVEILRALVPALKRGARIVVNDGGLPEPSGSPAAEGGYYCNIEEKTMRTMDLLMQVTVNAREKEAGDWEGLFRRADERYRVNRVWRPDKARMYFIEAEWLG